MIIIDNTIQVIVFGVNTLSLISAYVSMEKITIPTPYPSKRDDHTLSVISTACFVPIIKKKLVGREYKSIDTVCFSLHQSQMN